MSSDFYHRVHQAHRGKALLTPLNGWQRCVRGIGWKWAVIKIEWDYEQISIIDLNNVRPRSDTLKAVNDSDEINTFIKPALNRTMLNEARQEQSIYLGTEGQYQRILPFFQLTTVSI